MSERLDIHADIKDIIAKYDKVSEGNNFTALIMGLFGTGKTRFITTGRRPILIDSFDPRGTTVIHSLYPEEIGKSIFIRTYWEESSVNPIQHAKWERQWQKDIRNKFFDNFGTYAIDSMTTFVDALSWRVSKLEGGSKREGGRLLIQDYVPIYNTIKDTVKISSSQACDFIVTAHLVDYQNELTGEITAELDTYKRLKSQVPILFTEKYVIMTTPTSAGPKYELLTQPFSKYRASTQLGANGSFNMKEEPNIKKLLQKAGFSFADKPSIV